MSRLLILGFGVGLACAAPAQTGPLVDPTRPPNASPESAGEIDAVAGPRLQSVLISPTRRAAVISGTAVALGGTYGSARVEDINESAVVLRYPDRRETLQLLPSRDKRARGAPANHKENPR
ncbi:MAG TPA: MSHA biogenesis protein MshK [Burkholderiales bacterium]